MRQRHQDDFAEFFDAYALPLRRMAYRRLHDWGLASDATLETFVRLYRGWRRDRDGDPHARARELLTDRMPGATTGSLDDRRDADSIEPALGFDADTVRCVTDGRRRRTRLRVVAVATAAVAVAATVGLVVEDGPERPGPAAVNVRRLDATAAIRRVVRHYAPAFRETRATTFRERVTRPGPMSDTQPPSLGRSGIAPVNGQSVTYLGPRASTLNVLVLRPDPMTLRCPAGTGGTGGEDPACRTFRLETGRRVTVTQLRGSGGGTRIRVVVAAPDATVVATFTRSANAPRLDPDVLVSLAATPGLDLR